MFDPIRTPIMGNLVNEPVSRVVPNTDEELVGFRVAIDNGYWDRDKREEVKTGTTFISVTCKGKLGEHVLASNYAPGTRLIILGDLSTKAYETKEGEKRLDVKVKAIDIGPSNLWTEVKVPPRERREERPQASGYGSPSDGGQNWQPRYRDTPARAPQDDPWAQS